MGPDSIRHSESRMQKAPSPKTGATGPSAFVELRGIEPRSYGAESGLLRVQSVWSLFSAPALEQTRRRQAQSQKSPDHTL